MIRGEAESRRQYFQQAALLRWCLGLNQEDFKFSRNDGRIIYLMDANVVRFFANPEAEAEHVTPFIRPGKFPDYAAATALITAEFLFSRELAGQQHGPAFLAPAHGEEVSSIVQGLRRDARAHAEKESQDDFKIDVREVKAIVDAFKQGSIDRQWAAEQLKATVPQLARLLLAGPFQSIIQLRRLYDEDLLRPLSLHTGATLDILEPDRCLVASWAKRIGESRATGTRHERLRIERDAEVLVQTMLLDDAAVHNGNKNITQYVLVTADHAMVDAYVKWYWSGERPETARFVLRMPLQYAPILNSFEMPNDINSSTVTDRAAKALDSLFENLQRADPDYVARLLWYRTLARSGQDELEKTLTWMYGANPLELKFGGGNSFESASRLWHYAFRAGVVLNARLINRRGRADLDFLEQSLREDVDLRKEIYDHQERSLARIEATHTAYATRLNVSVLQAQLQSGARQRAYPAIRASIAALGNRSVVDILTAITEGDEELLSKVDMALEKEDTGAYFLAACIAHRCGQWAAAAIYARRALELMSLQPGPDDVTGEVAFVHASAIRYSIAASPIGDTSRLATVPIALSLLSDSEKNCEVTSDTFGVSRALSERCALKIMRLYYRWISELPTPSDELIELQRFAVEYQHAVSLMNDLSVAPASPEEPLRRLMLQRHANFISAWVFANKLAPDSPEAKALNIADWKDPVANVAEFRALAKPDYHSPIMDAECEMALVAANYSDVESATTKLAQLELEVYHDSTTLLLDREEISRFRTILIDEAHKERTKAYA